MMNNDKKEFEKIFLESELYNRYKENYNLMTKDYDKELFQYFANSLDECRIYLREIFNTQELKQFVSNYLPKSIQEKDEATIFLIIDIVHLYLFNTTSSINSFLIQVIDYYYELYKKNDYLAYHASIIIENVIDYFIAYPEQKLTISAKAVLEMKNSDYLKHYLLKAETLLNILERGI